MSNERFGFWLIVYFCALLAAHATIVAFTDDPVSIGCSVLSIAGIGLGRAIGRIGRSVA